MTPTITQSGISSSLAPVYRSDLSKTIGVLQQLQRLIAASGDASLADVIQVVRDMQRDFGEDAHIESVIQALVGRHLALQLASRRLASQQHHVVTMEVLV